MIKKSLMLFLVFIVLIMLASCQMSRPTSGGYNDITNKTIGWGFKKEKGKEPVILDEIKEMLGSHNAIYMGDKDKKKIYLTFDQGYENGNTTKILDILKEKNVKAAFFLTGDYFNRSIDLVERMVNEGHIVGNHSYYHHNLSKLSESEKIIEELDKLDKKYYEKFGVKMKYMRPPEGQYSERVLAVASDMGYKTVFWSFAYKDWIADDIKGADYAIEKIMPFVHNGEIMLLHAVSKDNTDALPTVIDNIRNMGYEFGTLDEISIQDKKTDIAKSDVS